MNDLDLQHLRTAIAVAKRAKQNGNCPFGATLVDDQGQILAEAENNQVTTQDCTGHAETHLLRVIAGQYSSEQLANYTMYASTEPCPMCAGAIFWSGLGRLVYALSADRFYDTQEADDSPYQLRMSCREVLAAGKRSIEIEGPALEDEALMAFK
ncbi:MAG: nucleoside deaminase [Thainema sp.]